MAAQGLRQWDETLHMQRLLSLAKIKFSHKQEIGPESNLSSQTFQSGFLPFSEAILICDGCLFTFKWVFLLF